MKKIYAITGGIGSGKSTVAGIIKNCGYAVLSADATYANLIKTPTFSKKIYDALGLEYNELKGFDSKEVSAAVFDNAEKLKTLNSITHNKIISEMFKLSESCGDVVFHEVPLLFEGGYQNRYDGVIIVKRNLNDRIKSVTLRDGLTENQIKKRIKNQFDYENLTNFKHTVIENDGDLNNLKRKTMAVLDEIVKNL